MEWQQVLDNPLLQNLPFKIELNKWGNILMSPASNNHGRWQFEVGLMIKVKKQSGVVITECSIATAEGVKVADVAWLSDVFVAKYGFETPYEVAPEICVEIVSPSNSKEEMQEKIRLYLNQGAKEVWLCNQVGKLSYYAHSGELLHSEEVGELIG
ncbi:MAG: Uma2 family endonuclease [Gammaproteobacteria bacterium]|nr:Uma2 family endonuclease [Gammaproteobacteria bacterium]